MPPPAVDGAVISFKLRTSAQQPQLDAQVGAGRRQHTSPPPYNESWLSGGVSLREHPTTYIIRTHVPQEGCQLDFSIDQSGSISSVPIQTVP
jgi:hypothetical protein